MIKILDPVYCKADKTLIPKIRPILSYKGTYRKPSQYGVQIETYNAFLIDQNGIFLSGLLPKITKALPNIEVEGEPEKLVPTSKPSLPGITPRSDQSKLIQQAIDQQRGVLLSPTGSGKTIVALLLFSAFPKAKILFLCHSLSIIDQTFTELNKFKFKNVQILGGGRKNFSKTADITLATIQTFVKLDPSKYVDFFDITVVDECFPAGTKIKTMNDDIPIEDIDIGSIIYAKERPRKVTDVFKNRVSLNRIIKLTLSNGKIIFCTEDHLLYADSKWTRANQSLGKKLLDFSTINNYNGANHHYNFKGEKNDNCKITKKTNGKMSHLWKSVLSKAPSHVKKILLQKMSVQPGEKKDQFRNNDKNKQMALQNQLRTNEEKQSHERSKNNRKDEKYQKDKWNPSYLERETWGKWNLYRTTNTLSYCFGMGDGGSSTISYASSCWTKKKTCRYKWISNLLQNRRRKREIKNRGRSGWERPSTKRKSSPGSKENQQTKPIRVENIEVYKRGNNDGSFKGIIRDKERDQGFVEFYDLEVETEHCYFANGVLVHNCHHVQSRSSQYAKVMEKNLSPMRIGLTATLPNTTEGKLCLEGYLGPVIGEVTVQEGVEKKILAKPKVKLIPVPFTSSVGELYKYQDIYKWGIVENRTRNRIIIEEAKKQTDQGKTVLIMVKEIAHGDNLVKMAKDLFGFEIIFVQGKTEGENRQLVQKTLDKKIIKCVVCTAVWREGINIKSLNTIILALGGKSAIQTAQALGRGLRIDKGKDAVLLADLLDPYRYLSQHAIARISLYVNNKWM